MAARPKKYTVVDYQHQGGTMDITGRPKAYSYVRFSTPEQELGDSQRRQIDKAAKYAQDHGLELDACLKNLVDSIDVWRTEGRRYDFGIILRWKHAPEEPYEDAIPFNVQIWE